MNTFSQPWMVNLLRLANLPIDISEIIGKKFIAEFSCRDKGVQAIAGTITGLLFENDLSFDDQVEADTIVAERHLSLIVSNNYWLGYEITGLWWRDAFEWELIVSGKGAEDMNLVGTLTLF